MLNYLKKVFRHQLSKNKEYINQTESVNLFKHFFRKLSKNSQNLKKKYSQKTL